MNDYQFNSLLDLFQTILDRTPQSENVDFSVSRAAELEQEVADLTAHIDELEDDIEGLESDLYDTNEELNTVYDRLSELGNN